MGQIELTQASGLKPAVEALRRRGIDADSYLRRNRIPPDFIELPYAPIPKRRRLWRFLEDVEQNEGIQTLGFLMGDTMNLADAGPMGVLLTREPTLARALKSLRHNIANFAQKDSVRLERHGDTAWLFCESHHKTCRPADHLSLMFLISIVRLAAGDDWRPDEVRLQTGPVESIRHLPLFSHCKVHFNCPHAGVRFPAALLDSPLPGYDPATSADLADLPPIPDTGKLSDSLRVIVASLLPYQGPPGAEEAADMAGMSRATLFRRLAAESLSYKQLVEDVRFHAACRHLRNPDLSVKDVAHLVGYSVPNNFIRAFRHRAGLSPLQFRRQQCRP